MAGILELLKVTGSKVYIWDTHSQVVCLSLWSQLKIRVIVIVFVQSWLRAACTSTKQQRIHFCWKWQSRCWSQLSTAPRHRVDTPQLVQLSVTDGNRTLDWRFGFGSWDGNKTTRDQDKTKILALRAKTRCCCFYFSRRYSTRCTDCSNILLQLVCTLICAGSSLVWRRNMDAE